MRRKREWIELSFFFQECLIVVSEWGGGGGVTWGSFFFSMTTLQWHWFLFFFSFLFLFRSFFCSALLPKNKRFRDVELRTCPSTLREFSFAAFLIFYFFFLFSSLFGTLGRRRGTQHIYTAGIKELRYRFYNFPFKLKEKVHCQFKSTLIKITLPDCEGPVPSITLSLLFYPINNTTPIFLNS